jgi:hypothetical protein
MRKLPHELFHDGKMRVPLRRLNVGVSQDRFETPDVSDLDHVPGGENMSEVMGADPWNLCPLDQSWEVAGGEAAPSGLPVWNGLAIALENLTDKLHAAPVYSSRVPALKTSCWTKAFHSTEETASEGRCMTKRILLEELPATATRKEVIELLSDVGTVVSIARYPTNAPPNSSSFMVEMSSDEEAATVIALFNLEGIRVKLAS